jgi:hypothetical protein
MAGSTGMLIALAAVVLLAPLGAWLGRSQGRKIKGGWAIIFLSMGAIFDPPRRHAIEAIEREEEASETSGEPEDPETGH